MQNMPSPEQMHELLRKMAPDVRISLQRFRAAMLGALTTPHRAEIGEFVGQYLLSSEPDASALVARIDGLLDRTERERIVAFMDAYVADQDAMRPAFEAAFTSAFPDLAMNANAEESQPPLPRTPPSMACTILANWLLAPQPQAIETMSFAQTMSITPFSWSGPETAQLRRRMRSHMLDAISISHRVAISDAIARCAVSADPDRAALAKDIDAILSPDEAKVISDGYAEFAAAQKAAHSKTPSSNAVMSDEPAGAGARFLSTLFPGPSITAGFHSGADRRP
jgi:hypothetical protein